MNLLKIAVTTAVLLTPAQLWAQEQSSLADIIKNIKATGFNQTATQLHEVDIENCILTAMHFQLSTGKEPKLISSVQADVRGLTVPISNEKEAERFLYIERGSEDQPEGMSVTFFQMHPPFEARLETKLTRALKLPFRPSPRKADVRFVYKQLPNFTIVHEGLVSPDKPRSFIAYLRKYRDTYCLTVS